MLTEAERQKRVDLYQEVNAGKLVGAHQRLIVAIEAASKRVEEFPSSPYSKSNAESMRAQVEALALVSEDLRRWHIFLHPENG